MSNWVPTSPFKIQAPITPDVQPFQQIFGTHFSTYGIGGYSEVLTLSELSIFSSYTLNIDFTTSNNEPVLYLYSDNVSSGKRKLGQLVYVYETDTIYQFFISDYVNKFTATTASTIGTRRAASVTSEGTTIYGITPEANTFLSGWTANTIDGISGETYTSAVWRKLSFSGSSSGGTISGGGTINYISKWTGSTSLGDSSLFDNGTKVVSSVQMDAPAFSGATIYLGLDSSGNTRTITADSVLLNNDILNGGTY